MNEETEPRTIDELLKLKTFQDMTDEEIGLVIEWRERQAAQKERDAVDWLKIRLDAQATYEAELARASHATQVLDRLVAKSLGEA